jgi:hypothetical protein
MTEMPSCFRCVSVELRRLPESSTGVEFLECPSCRRHYARRSSGPLTYRWLHPITLALYGVIFDEDPVPQAVPQAEAFLRGRPPDELRRIVGEIELELNEPTHEVRNALENHASEEKCREYLRAFVAHIRAHA